MTATITAGNGAGETVPHFILVPYETRAGSRNIVHELIGGGIDVTLAPTSPRTGTLELLYLTEAEAFACADLHQYPTVYTLVETDRPRVDMTYVLGQGGVSVRLESDAHSWIVTIDYQEVIT
jgi:hypothetical protein